MGLTETTAKRLAHFSLLFFAFLSFAAAQPMLRVSAQDYDDFSRVIVTLPSALSATLEKDGNLLLVRINSTSPFRLRTEPVKSRFIKSFSWVTSSDLYIIVIEVRHERFRQDSFQIEKKRQLVIDFYELTAPPAAEAAGMEAQEVTPEPEKKGETHPAVEAAPPPVEGSPAAAKGTRTVVIDTGHGGLEDGANRKHSIIAND